MAKLGEGDPRWLVEERADGQNVGGWHWREKDVSDWGKEKFRELFNRITFVEDDEGTFCKVTKVDKVSGEATVALRKAKHITLYEYDLTLSWEGIRKGNKLVKGTIAIHVEQDEEPEIRISTSVAGSEASLLKEIMQVQATSVIREKVEEWLSGLKDQGFKTDVCKERPTQKYTTGVKQEELEKTKEIKKKAVSQASPANTSTTKMYSSVEPKKSTSNGSLQTKTVNGKINFRARSSDVYDALLDAQKVMAFTRSAASIKAEEGSEFVLFNGNVTGSIETLTRNEMIVQKWRFSDWPADHYSKVTLKFKDNSDGCVLTLSQTGVPSSDVERTREGWNRFYWNQMRAVFGWGVSFF